MIRGRTSVCQNVVNVSSSLGAFIRAAVSAKTIPFPRDQAIASMTSPTLTPTPLHNHLNAVPPKPSPPRRYLTHLYYFNIPLTTLELILNIFTFLPPATLLTVIPLVCRHLNELSYTPALHLSHFKHIRDPEFHRTEKDTRQKLPPLPFPARTYRELHLCTYQHLPYLNQLVVTWNGPQGDIGVTRYKAAEGVVRIHVLDGPPVGDGGELNLDLEVLGCRFHHRPREESKHDELWTGEELMQCYDSGAEPADRARFWVLDPARWRDVPEDSPEGLWAAVYGPHGLEIVLLMREGAKMKAVKLTGDPNVPAGEVTWEVEEWEGEERMKGRGKVANDGFVERRYALLLEMGILTMWPASWVDSNVQQIAPDVIRVDWIIPAPPYPGPAGMFRNPMVYKKLDAKALRDVVDGKERHLNQVLPPSPPAQWIPAAGLLPFVASLFGGLTDDDEEGIEV